MTDERCPLNAEGECRCGYESDYLGCGRVRTAYDSKEVVTADEALFRLLARDRARVNHSEETGMLRREDD